MGYVAHERTLKINEEQAKLIRNIYERYLTLGSVRLLKLELDKQGITTRKKGYPVQGANLEANHSPEVIYIRFCLTPSILAESPIMRKPMRDNIQRLLTSRPGMP